ncbi:putative 39S ribosomal protein L28, mitochondrial [Apostichopus japonicus]|uniref:Large ribosomal subunit protein bL28m n=1 Tax=Stichopus japonicus TaxID=307972 RepID=A0A2G8LMT1_STIJA|nr:putative 39S ribosomal protein L28, mitochondrial [Apostichopus japonicus]
MNIREGLFPAIWGGFYEEGVASRLPEAYFKHNRPFAKPPTLHWMDPGRDYVRDPVSGEKVKLERRPIPIEYPEESQFGLWGGEGIIIGKKIAKRNKRFSPGVPKEWKPCTQKRTLYSEILDRKFELDVTVRVMDFIDDAYGFDFYILKTPSEELNSLAGMILKRHMCLQLAQPETLYPNNKEKKTKILKKYRQFIYRDKCFLLFATLELLYEEAEWVGLTPGEAVQKQRAIEAKANPDIPLQDVYTQELLTKLREESEGVYQMAKEEPE